MLRLSAASQHGRELIIARLSSTSLAENQATHAPIAYQIVLKPSVKQPQPHVHFRLMERSRFVIAAGLPFRFSDTNVESGLPKNGKSFVSAAVRRLGNGQGQVQRVGVVVSPSVGIRTL